MFPKRLRALRMQNHFTQQHMADMLCISLNAYQKYEQGERFPSVDTLINIADMLDASIDFLLGRDAFLTSRGACLASEFLEEIRRKP